MMTIPFLLGIALALLVERLHYQPKAIRRAVEAMEDEATRNAARQFEIWKGVWLKDQKANPRPWMAQMVGRAKRNESPSPLPPLDFLYKANRAGRTKAENDREDFELKFSQFNDIQFPKKTNP